MFCFTAHTNHSLGFQAAFELILNTIGPQKGVPVAGGSLKHNYAIS